MPAPYFRGVNPVEVKHEYGIRAFKEYPSENEYCTIILVVAHKGFTEINILKHKDPGCLIYIVKGILCGDLFDARL